MFETLHLYNATATPRSPHWHGVRNKFLSGKTCAACGGGAMLNAHHIKPFHLFPALELDETNLIALCEQPGRNCHFVVGHCFDWHAYNPFVVADAALLLKRIHDRLTV